MAVNPTSLENLSPGNRKGTRNKITKEYALRMTEYLMNDFDVFISELDALSPKDKVVAKLKLMDIFMPKKQEIEVEAIETPKWEIVKASDALKLQAAQEAATSATEVIEEAQLIELTNPDQLAIDFPEPVVTAAPTLEELVAQNAALQAQVTQMQQRPAHPMGLTIQRASQV